MRSAVLIIAVLCCSPLFANDLFEDLNQTNIANTEEESPREYRDSGSDLQRIKGTVPDADLIKIVNPKFNGRTIMALHAVEVMGSHKVKSWDEKYGLNMRDGMIRARADRLARFLGYDRVKEYEIEYDKDSRDAILPKGEYDFQELVGGFVKPWGLTRYSPAYFTSLTFVRNEEEPSAPPQPVLLGNHSED